MHREFCPSGLRAAALILLLTLLTAGLDQARAGGGPEVTSVQSGNWLDAATWDLRVPDIDLNDHAMVQDVVSVTAVTSDCNTVTVGLDAGPGVLNIVSGSLTIQLVELGIAAETGVLNVNGGLLDGGGEPLPLLLVGSNGIFNLKGGTTDLLDLTTTGGGVNVSGGTLTAQDVTIDGDFRIEGSLFSLTAASSLQMSSSSRMIISPTGNGELGLAPLQAGNVLDLPVGATLELEISNYFPGAGDSWDVIVGQQNDDEFTNVIAPEGVSVTQDTSVPGVITLRVTGVDPVIVSASDNIFEDVVRVAWSAPGEQPTFFEVYRTDPDTQIEEFLSLVAGDSREYLDATGTPGVVYSYLVKAFADVKGGFEIGSDADDGSRIIFGPDQVEATDGEFADRVDVSWFDRSFVEEGFNVYRKISGEPDNTFLLLGATEADAQFFADATPDSGVVYEYCVAAFDIDGNESDQLCDDGERGFILAPGSVAASDGQYVDQVLITWLDLTDEEAAYRVYRDGALIATLLPDSTSYSDTDELGLSHTYCVAAVREILVDDIPTLVESPWACDEGIGGPLTLSAPDNFVATIDEYDDKVILRWDDTDTEDTFELLRDGEVMAEFSANTTSFDDADAEAGTLHSYCIRAKSILGGSSVDICADGRRSVILAPTNVAASDGDFEDHVLVTWESTATSVVLFKVQIDGFTQEVVSGEVRSAIIAPGSQFSSEFEINVWVVAVTASGDASPAGVDTGFRLFRAPTNAAATDGEFEDQVVVTWEDQSDVESGFRISRREAGTSDIPDSVGTALTNASSFTDRTGVSGMTYEYLVTSIYSADPVEGHDSEASTDEGSRFLLEPTEMTATVGDFEDRIELEWTDNSFAESGYVIRRNGTVLDSLSSNTREYTDLGEFGGDQDYTVAAYDLYGESAADSASGSTSIQPPGSVSATTTYQDRVVVTWTDESDIETEYQITRDGELIGTVGTDTTRFEDTGAIVDTPYQYCVVAVRSSPVATSVPGCADGFVTSEPDDPVGVPGELVARVFPTDGEEGNEFGRSVAVGEGFAVVGAPQASGGGAVYLFRRSGDDWEGLGKYSGGTVGNNDEFGFDVAIDGNTVVVGAPYDDDGPSNSGAVYFFTYTGSELIQIEKLLASEPTANARFGHGVAIDGDDAIGGTYGANKAFGITRDPGTGNWSVTRTMDSGDTGDLHGRSVAVGNGLYYVGAPAWSSNDLNSAGSVFVYEIGQVGLYENIEGTIAFEAFGKAISTANDGSVDILVGGGRLGYVLSQDFQGFYRDNRETLTPADGGIGGSISVALASNIAIVGYVSSTSGNDAPGEIRIFLKEFGGWVESNTLASHIPDISLGRDVAIDNEVVFAGAPDLTGVAGLAYVFDAPNPPLVLAASDGTVDPGVRLEWDDNSNRETGYAIFRDGEQIATTTPSAETYNDGNAEPGRVHEYRVASMSNVLGRTAATADLGYQRADGTIAGRVATRAGASVEGVQVCLDPAQNKGVLFDGFEGEVSIEEPTDSTLSEFTIEFWTRTTDQSDGVFWTIGVDELGNIINLSEPDRLVLRAGDGSGNNNAKVFGTPINDGEWHHLALTWQNGRTYEFYLDGEFLGGGDISSTNFNFSWRSDHNLVLGLPKGNGDPLNGTLDEVRLWGVVRTEAEINATKDALLTGREDDLVGYWPFDEGNGLATANLGEGNAGRLLGGAFWADDGSPIETCTLTDLEGNYTIPNLRYGDSATFRVIPNLGDRTFDPSFKQITIDRESPIQNEVQFLDITSYAIAGTINFEGTGCFPQNVPILVDGTLAGVTDSNGQFRVPAQPGVRVITPELEGRVFEPAFVRIDAQEDTAGIDYVETTLRTLSGRVGGGCDLPIGNVVLEIVSEDGCFGPELINTSDDYEILLPPQSYFIKFADVTDVPGALDRATILEFFRLLGPQAIDLTEADLTQDFIYRAPLSVEIVGFPSGACDGQLITDPDTGVSFTAVPILAQGNSATLTINVFENYGDGNLCPVDSGTVTIFDEIQDIADDPTTLEVIDGVATYTTIANLPSTTIGRVDVNGNDRSYQKPLTVVATVEGQVVQQIEWAIVTGDRPRTGTFVTAAAQEIPLLILRDPPGDGSSAFLERGTSFTTTISNAGLVSRTLGAKTETKAGLKFTAGTPFFSTDTATEAKNEFGFEIGLAANFSGEMEISTTTTETFSTSDDEVFAGADGDIFLGIGLNLVFAKTDVLEIDEVNCLVERSQSVRFGGEAGNAIETIFLYTDTHIRNTLIPQFEELATIEPDSAEIFLDNAATWSNFLALNDSLKIEAPSKENRSFSAGAEFQFETTTDTTSTSSVSISVFSTAEAALGFGFEAAGSGATAQLTSKWEFDYTFTDTNQDGSYVTVGYSLSDDDVGDFFSIDIGTDPSYGTPVFRTLSGRSSCPWEANTQPRDSLAITIEPPIATDVPVGEKATFTISLTNFSPSDELREYTIFPVQEANPGGAILEINGNPFGGGQAFFIAPGETQEITLTVERGPRRYFYEGLQLLAFAPCEFERFRNGGPLQLEDRVTFDVEFAAPCTDINLFEPVSGWAYNLAQQTLTNDSLSVTLNDFQIVIGDDEEIEAIGAEYRREDTDDWFPIDEVAAADIELFESGPNQGEPKSVQFFWDVALVDDAVYETRAFARCEAGKTISLPATGRIDRMEPRTFGAPEPADLVLALGDEISITFNEEIDCETVTSQTVSMEVENPDGDNIPFIFETVCDGRSIIFTPTSPALGTLEGQTIIVNVGLLEPATGSTIEDLAGNPLLSLNDDTVETWSFVVAQNEFTWARGKVFGEVAFRSFGQVTGELVNGTSEDQDYEIEDLPEWLTVTSTTGTLASGATEFIEFVVADTLSEGNYEVVVNAVIDDIGGNPIIVSPLTIEIDITCQPPTWAVNPADYEYTMTAIIAIGIGGTVSEDSNDLIAAFVGNEVRGLGSPESTIVDGQEEWLVFMNIFSNRAEGENVRFQVFDDSDCLVYGSADRFFRFDETDRRGTPADPELLVAQEAASLDLQAISVNEGWTWFSVNLIQQDMTLITILGDLNPRQGDVIISQTTGVYAEFDESTGWNGTLETLNIFETYAINVSEAGTILHEGSPVSATTPISLVDGWNWVGYPPSTSQEIGAALANQTPANGDVFKSQLGFSEYNGEGTELGWVGNLDVLEPGGGYKLFVDDRLTFGGGFLIYTDPGVPGPALLTSNDPEISGNLGVGSSLEAGSGNVAGPGDLQGWMRSAQETRDQATASARGEFGENWPDWKRDYGYQYSMSMVALVENNDEMAGQRGARLAAFVDGEVRGVADLVYAPALRNYTAFLLVQTNEPNGELVEFRYYDPETDTVYKVAESMIVDIEERSGDLLNPVVLRTSAPIDGGTTTPISFRLDQHYPNPAPTGTRVAIRWAQPVEERVRIEVFDIQGRLVSTVVDESLSAGWHTREFDTASMPSGIYFYRMLAGDFGAVQKLLLVK